MPTINNPSATDWQSALSAFPSASFLQSWAWGEFQAELGNNVVRVLLQDGGKNVGLAQTYVVKSKFDSFLYCPRGPLAHSEAALGELLQMLKQVIDMAIAPSPPLGSQTNPRAPVSWRLRRSRGRPWPP